MFNPIKIVTMKKILLPYGVASLMANKYGYSLTYISLTMNFQKNSRRARALRKIAILEHGGQPVGVTREEIVDYDKFTRDNIETQESVSL